jgi:hypothetical protein
MTSKPAGLPVESAWFSGKATGCRDHPILSLFPCIDE